MAGTHTSAERRSIPFRSIFIAVAAVWTMAAAAVLVGDRNDRQSFLASNALNSARATFEKDIAFRRWAARHGGVYVPVTPENPPNPYLTVPERDIVTPSGRALTLMNPAYMNRQVYEISSSYSGAPQGHITSLNPLRPENAPDSWEKKALSSFEKGQPEFSEFQTIDGKPYFRFMRPLKAEKSCLKCHAGQGYREGDIRGGISVSIPVSDMMASSAQSGTRHSGIVIIVWLLGITGLWFGLRRIGLSSLALQESEERYRQQFRQSRAIMLIIDPESGAIVEANPAACSFYGYASEEMLALNISDISASPPAELAERVSRVLDESTPQFLTRHHLSDGSIVDVEVFSNPVSYHGKTLLHSIIVDVTGRLVAEQELRDKMDFAENLILNSTTPTFVINFDHQVLIWNRAMEELSGISAEDITGTGEHWRAFYPSARPCLCDIVLEGAYEEASELYPHLSRSRLIPGGLRAEGDYVLAGRTCRLVFSAAPIRDRDGRVIAAIETLEDVTERISLEAQLLHAQKMESVGVLAGGIAHDFNNVLTVINGYADLLKITLPDDKQSRQIADEISASVERAADMTQSLLAFSGKREMLMQPDDMNQILASIRKSLVRLIREDITLMITPCGEQLPVYVDRGQMEQVLINLVVNARDAVGSGGTIAVTTLRVQLEETYVQGNTVIPPGCYACLCVGDSGDGMDGATIERIFEPFFTTKEKGKGTGLGLTIVYNITAKHSGNVSVTSAPGKGTEFRVYLPLYTGEVFAKRAMVSETVNHHGTETVLVVEDDIAIMKLHDEFLGRYGYTILAARDGIEAMELFDAYLDEIQIVVVDVIMPRMNGREVVERIRNRRPELPVIMTSGYTDEIIDRGTIDTLKVKFLQKPVKPFDLLAEIRSCLHSNE